MLAIAAVGSAATAAAQTSGEYIFEIDRTPLRAALVEFSLQTGLQVSYVTKDSGEGSELVGPLKGRYTVESALNQLVAGTGLTYTRVNGSTISLVPKGPVRTRLARLDAEAAPVAASGRERAALPTEQGQLKRATLEEIIVTAQKRSERIEDVPIAISVLGGDVLDSSKAKGVVEALKAVPGLVLANTDLAGATTVTMRGVASGGALFNGSSTVAYYADSVPFGLVKSALVPDPSVYDLDRIEVLRGPQGTLYGANSVNGVVRVLTKDAELDELSFKVRAGGSTVKGGGDGYSGDMAFNMPIIEDALAARVVAGYNHVPGWIDKPDREDANDADLTNVRLKLNGKVSDALSVGASVWLSRGDYGTPPRSNLNDERPNTLDESLQADFDAYGLKVGYDFGGATLTSATGYLDYTNEGQIDIGLPLVTDISSRVFSEEVLLSSSDEGAWLWSLGAFYRKAKDNLYQDILPTGSIIPAPIDFDDHSTSSAYFGQITRKVMDGRLELTAGLRYFRDKVEQIENVANDGDPNRPLIHDTQVFTAWTPRAVVSWHPSESSIVYASYSEGFRSGFNQNANILVLYPDLPAAKPDKLHNYEVGTKGLLASGRLSYEVAVFYVDWQDIQQTIGLPVGGTFATALVNGQSASGPGVDLSLTIRPVTGLALGLSASYNDLTMDGDLFSSGVLLFQRNDRLNFSSEYTAGGSADYLFAIGGTGYNGQLSAAVNYVAGYDTRDVLGDALTLSSGDNITDASASFTVTTPNNLEATIFVENLTDDRGSYEVDAFDPAQQTRHAPRRIGVQVEYRF